MKIKKSKASVSTSRPPIVAVLGHVDHGKTSLLDNIRHTHVTEKEHGGITQHIGAYQIEVKGQTTKGKLDEKRLITFIDTPGHEAFAKMRSRGAAVADIAILVVAADDSVMPQTKESIDQIKAAKVPMIVALNKIDLPAAKPDKVKQDLAKVGVQVEGFGGDVPIVPVSAKTGIGIPELLDMILLVSDLAGLERDEAATLAAVVIETRVDKGKGTVATLIVKKGTLTVGHPLYDGATQVAKVRAMFDENGVSVAAAGSSKPVEVLGFTVLPQVGSLLQSQPTLLPETSPSLTPEPPKGIPDFLKPKDEQEKQKLIIVLKADAAGSLEAIRASLDERVKVVGSGIGDISEADILHAKSSRAVIIGFNVKCPPSVEKLAQTEKVVFRTYSLIYELLKELADVVSGMKEVIAVERELGTGKIIAEFPYEDMRIAGTRVLTGRLAKGDTVKIIAGETEAGRAKIKSLRVGKEDVTKVTAGSECGVLLDVKLDFTLGDAIIAFTTG